MGNVFAITQYIKISLIYCITGIIHGRKVLRFTFFAIAHEKTFEIQAISYIKILAEIKVQENIRKCFQICEICELFLPRTIPIIRYKTSLWDNACPWTLYMYESGESLLAELKLMHTASVYLIYDKEILWMYIYIVIVSRIIKALEIKSINHNFCY